MTAVELAEAQRRIRTQVIVRWPPVSPLRRPKSGRGLFLIAMFSDRWGPTPRRRRGQGGMGRSGMNLDRLANPGEEPPDA